MTKWVRYLVLVLAIGLMVLMVAVAWPKKARADVVSDALGCTGDPCVITFNQGGLIEDYVKAGIAIEKGGRMHVRVEGECDSACIIAIDIGRNRTCVTPQAKLGFHKAFWARKYRTADGRIEYRDKSNYADMPVRADIARVVHRRGGFPRDTLLWVHASEVTHIWPLCDQFPAHGLY